MHLETEVDELGETKMIGKVSDEVKQQMNKEILYFSFGIRCLSTSLMALETLVEILKRNLALFVCPNPLAIPACTEYRTWIRLSVPAESRGLQNNPAVEMHLQVSLGIPSTSFYWEVRNGFKMSQGKTLGLIYFEVIPCILLPP